MPSKIMGRAVRAMPQIDRAIIKGDFSAFTASKHLSKMSDMVKMQYKGNKLIGCGFPLGGPLYCADLVFIQRWGFMFAVKGVLIPGMSGGPVMLLDGTVVATNTAVEDTFDLVSPFYNIDINF